MSTDSPPVMEKPKSSGRSLAEWVSFSIASSILMLLVGLVIFRWLTGEDHPPVLSVTVGSEIREVNGQFYVDFSLSNTGGVTAESVQVMAELTAGDVEESGEQQIDFLSGGEVEEGAFIFSHDPRKGELVVRVASYKLP